MMLMDHLLNLFQLNNLQLYFEMDFEILSLSSFFYHFSAITKLGDLVGHSSIVSVDFWETLQKVKKHDFRLKSKWFPLPSSFSHWSFFTSHVPVSWLFAIGVSRGCYLSQFFRSRSRCITICQKNVVRLANYDRLAATTWTLKFDSTCVEGKSLLILIYYYLFVLWSFRTCTPAKFTLAKLIYASF